MLHYQTVQTVLINSISAKNLGLLGLLKEFLKLNRIHNNNELLLAFENTLI